MAGCPLLWFRNKVLLFELFVEIHAEVRGQGFFSFGRGGIRGVEEGKHGQVSNDGWKFIFVNFDI